MATVLQLRFPGRRYHATPWGHHVNEGTVEWPPSPWRLFRALLATGFSKAGWDAAEPPIAARALIESLAASLPSYWLPPAALSHSRHYVDAAGKKPLILDAWVHLDDQSVVEVSWDVDLPVDQRAVLAELVPLLSYLGRAESWVDAQLLDAPTRPANCHPIAELEGPARHHEPIRVLCAQSADAYAAWRDRITVPIEASLPVPTGKKPTAKLLKDRAKALAPYPENLLAALCAETGWLQSHGWSAAPGSRPVTYNRRTDALEVGPPLVRRERGFEVASMALLAITTPSRNLGALPSLARTFPQARLLHRALASAVDRCEVRGAAMALLGRERDTIAAGGHRHAHLLYLDLDGDARLDHVLVWAPGGLDGDALLAVRGVRRTWMKGGVGELQVATTAVGEAATLRQIGEPLRSGLARVLGPAGGSRTWTSVTPFVAARFLKKRGSNSLEGQVLESLAQRHLPPARVEMLDSHSDLSLSFRHFVLGDDRIAPPVRAAHAIRLTFDTPVEGPICLGFGSHYGLGRFGCTVTP